MWFLHAARTENQVSLQAHLTTLSLTDQEDYYEWEIDGTVSGKYSMGLVYQELRQEQEVVPWGKIVWNRGGIPKHNFLVWLFVMNRCPTRDRILGWGLQTDPHCLLCNSGMETRDHLLFDCPVSWLIWSEIARRCNLQSARGWSDSNSQMKALVAGNVGNRLTLIAWQASIYWIWHERNERLFVGGLHHGANRSPDS
ncbi:unnamed protein product [Microthlaspi erraticum]|uniref:Reverse transcriptase zinc-binding domain-containing protein n=1 Tax=Microthlaspi erraticum TaxID=1685480 RepID=A0A6D2K5P5_9BRAS|nr:unnamed protein product [Microthlaspi erraticum]